MQLALAQARQGIGLTAPNPPVGAVIIMDGQVLGQGYHRKAGEPHAEIEALRSASASGADLAKATIYITLEPCSTHGRTPPCAEALIAARLGRVVWGARDPNPAHQGRAESILLKAGLSVTTGVCESECQDILRPFAKRITTGLPSARARVTSDPWPSCSAPMVGTKPQPHKSGALSSAGSSMMRMGAAFAEVRNLDSNEGCVRSPRRGEPL